MKLSIESLMKKKTLQPDIRSELEQICELLDYKAEPDDTDQDLISIIDSRQAEVYPCCGDIKRVIVAD